MYKWWASAYLAITSYAIGKVLVMGLAIALEYDLWIGVSSLLAVIYVCMQAMINSFSVFEELWNV